MSCYKYSHWDPFVDVNLKYHWQGIRLSLSASLLFEAAWKIQCSIVRFWCHPWQSSINDVTLNASITLDVIEHCKYLTLARNYFYCPSGIDLWTDRQLIHVSRPVIAICSRVEQGGWLWGQMGWRYISYYPCTPSFIECLDDSSLFFQNRKSGLYTIRILTIYTTKMQLHGHDELGILQYISEWARTTNHLGCNHVLSLDSNLELESTSTDRRHLIC